MLKEPLLFASMIAGGSAFIGSAYGAFAAQEPSPTSLIVSESPAPRAQALPLSIDSDGELASEITFEPAMVTASVSAQPMSRLELRACTDWSVVGAIYQGPMGASGLHHVRDLCY